MKSKNLTVLVLTGPIIGPSETCQNYDEDTKSEPKADVAQR